MVGLPYPIRIAPGALDQLGDIARSVAPANRIIVITDQSVGQLYSSRVAGIVGGSTRESVIAIPASEKLKTRETWSTITDLLLDRGFGRDTTIVALGGGVIGDIVGFVAATYMRGVPVIQVPTTLLAMVDASIGGKTGVDTRHGKNLVGAFYQPAAVVIDPSVLETLPVEHFRAGLAEVVKHGVIADADYFARVSTFVEAWPGSAAKTLPEALTELIRRSVEIKAGIVNRDERESGLRKVLNFGHTIGHAIEAASRFEMLHGEAVAIGLVIEARMAERIGVATSGTAREIEHVCERAGLPTSVPQIPVNTLVEFTRADKKAIGGRVEYALPKRIGEMAGADRGWAIPVDDAAVREALRA